MIELKEVTKKYNNLPILENVSLTIDEGDIYGIIGESGSGKTTLLNLIAGFISPTTGKVMHHLPGRQEAVEVHEHMQMLKKHIGYTAQHNSFYPRLTIKENLLHFGLLYGLPRPLLINNIKSLLHFTKLFDHRNKLAEHLSEGMQRRLDISCSMVHKPSLLLLDEPTADLDSLLQKEILALLQEVRKQGVTIIMVSHDLKSVEEICNKVAIIHKGKVYRHGSLDEVKEPFLKEKMTINIRPSANKEALLAALQLLPIEKIIDKGNELVVYPTNVERTVSGLLQFIKQENLYFNDMDVRKPSLHEIFEKIAHEP